MNMVSDYFSWVRAKKNTEALAKTNPRNPVLKQDDEEFLERVTSQEPENPESGPPRSEHDEQQTIETEETSPQPARPAQKRTWASYVPSVSAPSISLPSISKSSIPSLPSWKTRNNGTKADEAAAYLAGIKVTENVKLDPVEQEEDQKEVSVLLDKLNLSAINNRVFSFSKESEKLYGNFTVVLKDMMNGAPTAYEDMEKLLKDNDAHLRDLFSKMPPFVQLLVKSLPAKLGSTLGPEMLAVATSERVGADMKQTAQTGRRSASPATGGRGNGGRRGSISTNNNKERSTNITKVPSVKTLSTQKGAVAGMLRSTVTFLQTKFPAFITGTNVIMSLAVFILLFVFYYCHKRGRETRLQREGQEGEGEEEEEVDILSVDDEDNSSVEPTVEAERGEEGKQGEEKMDRDDTHSKPEDSNANIERAAEAVKRRLDEADRARAKVAS